MSSDPRARPSDTDPEEAAFLEEVGAMWTSLAGRHGQCPGPVLLRAARAEVLPEQDAAAIAAHVAGCAACRALSADLPEVDARGPSEEQIARVRARIRAAGGGPSRVTILQRLRAPSWWVPITVAAGLLLLAALTYRELRVVPPQLHTAAAPPVRDELARLKLEPLPAPSFDWSVLVLRGAPGDEDGATAALAAAMEPYRSGDYAAAASRLAAAARKYPNAAEVHLYLGTSQLLLGDARAAVESLLAAQRLSTADRRDAATWYLAVAYQRSGASVDAAGQLRVLCGGRSRYAPDACAAVSRAGVPGRPDAR